MLQKGLRPTERGGVNRHPWEGQPQTGAVTRPYLWAREVPGKVMGIRKGRGTEWPGGQET